jgi:hypothetical protein
VIWRSSLALLALAVGLAACGEAKQDRFDLTTPGAHTGLGPVATPAPPSASATAPPKGKVRGKSGASKPKAGAKKPATKPAKARVTAEERRIIRGWSDELRQGHVAAASRYFGLPVLIVNPTQAILSSREAVESYLSGLPCGAKLLTTRRGEAGSVIATFRLTERPGGSCTGIGTLAAAEILVKKHHIISWLRRDDAIDPAATATPAPGGSGGGG